MFRSEMRFIADNLVQAAQGCLLPACLWNVVEPINCDLSPQRQVKQRPRSVPITNPARAPPTICPTKAAALSCLIDPPTVSSAMT